MAQHIVVCDYDPRWSGEFDRESALVRAILGDNCVELHHIGSTSVEGLAAKPIIDMMPVVRSLERVDAAAAEFEKIGYEYLGEFGMAGRRYLRKGGDERTHQIHIFHESNRRDIERHLAVRDYLRAHKSVRDEYAALKRELAAKHPYDIDGYCDGKEAFVQRMEADALAWKRG